MKKFFNLTQIKALLWKEYLVRIRQPWMTAIQFIWPVVLLISLYVLRLRFEPADIEACQFPSRQLPTKNGVLTFFQSYICTIDNECLNSTQYEEYSKFQDAPITPILNIVQTFMNDDALYNAIVGLPESGSFLNVAISVFTHAKFAYIKENIAIMQSKQSEYIEKIGDHFDITKIWNNDEAFSIFGNILCGKPFPRSNEIKLVENIFYHTDYAGPDKDELDAMPTPYCKQLYLDVTNTNHGKITWHQIKPIIQGKIIYGPNNEDTENIINNSNGTFEGIQRLRRFVSGIEETVVKLRTNVDFKSKLDGLITLAKSPLAATLLGGSVDEAGIDNVYNILVNDESIATVVITISNILDCISVDRFVPVNTESEMILYANKLNNKKLFYGGVYFEDGAQTFNETKTIEYKLRMEIDNTPITLQSRKPFWFPGPEASFTQDMRYHRGFIEIQHGIDTGIIKHIKKSVRDMVTDGNGDNDENKTQLIAPENKINIDLGWGDSDEDDNDGSTEIPNITAPTSATETSIENLSVLDFNLDDFLSFDDETTTTIEPIVSTTNTIENNDEKNNGELKQRKRRGILSGLFDSFVGNSNDDGKTIKFESDDMQYYTKQFPYPKYRNDEFKRGLYLAQAIQMAFFFGLIVQIAACVRQRLWMKESGNRRLMQIMGLLKSSELIAWLIITLMELEIISAICCIILCAGGMIQSTSILLLFIFFSIFGLSVLSFCYMTSSIFTSASIGCVSSALIFLTSFTPYIIIISFGSLLTFGQKFIANLSLSTAFCYALHFVMRTELQQKPLNFSNAFTGSITSNDFTFGLVMMIFDSIIYMLIGYLFERFFDDEYKFHKVATTFTSGIGASMINATKIYDQNTQPAVDKVSIEFRRDHVTCLLGRNGAGKSTIINLLTGQIRPTSGEIFLSPVLNDTNGMKDFVGLCPQNMVLIPNLTAKEHLYLYASIKLENGYREEVDRILDGLNFGKHELYRCENLSGGFKRRLNVGIAFIGSPNLVILDEPCNAVDTKARKQIWDTINVLKKGRAVILATHYMDEAEFLSDNVIFLNRGQIVSEHNMKSIKDQITESFDVKIKLTESLDRSLTIERIRSYLIDLPHGKTKLDSTGMILFIKAISYYDKDKNNNQMVNYEPLIRSLEQLQYEKKIQSFNVISKDLEGLFNSFIEETAKLNSNNKQPIGDSPVSISINGSTMNSNNITAEEETEKLPQMASKLTELTMLKMLFWKRLMHYKRNFRLILCMLVVPTLFTAIATAFLNLRPPGEFDTNLILSTDVYSNSAEFVSLEQPMKFNEKLSYQLHCDHLNSTTDSLCEHFNSSANAYNWILKTHDDYLESRYGGVSINGTTAAVWYNNKGYHAMPIWLNKLSSALLNAELNDEGYKIVTHNHPLVMGRKEMSASSILQQVADGGVSIILLISFSLLVAGSSVYIVNERVTGEKLQQKLCGISFRTYWGVSFVWELMIYSIAIALAVVVFQIFDIPEYTSRENLCGVIVLIFMFGFASIPMVHLIEKRFNDASLANMHILCLNIIIALVCRMIIILFDLLGTSDLSVSIRNFLNRIFLVFPQFAFGDGLVEIGQNHIIAEIFERYSIDTYKPPLRSDLILPHLLSLFIFGIVFSIINYLIESGWLHHWSNKLKWFQNIGEKGYDLQTASSLPTLAKTYDKFELSNNDYVLRVNNLYKSYGNEHQQKKKQQQQQQPKQQQWAVRNVSFNINVAECFGLLGVNGAGKSTIFSILSGQLRQSTGTVDFTGNKGISYCPQTNALDKLLTVEEVIRFYGTLRKIQNLDWLTTKILTQFHMEQYRQVLVKNLSGGNRRKLSVAVTCLGDTNLVLMDEPTSDMDPITRSLVYKSIHQLIKERRSVLLTSHTITEMDRVCHRIGVLQEGQLISVGPTDQLKSMFGSNYLITIFYDEQYTAVNVLEKHLLDILEQIRLDGIVHFKQCLQFSIKIDANEKNRTLSNIFDKMYKLCQNNNNMGYTISECLLDKAFERVIDSSRQINGNETYANRGFILNETST